MEEVVLPKREEIQKLKLAPLINLLASLPPNSDCESLKKIIYDKFSKSLYNAICRTCGKMLCNILDWMSVAEEIFQDTCLMFFQKIESKNFSLDPSISDELALNKIMKWLRKTAHNRIMEYLRNKNKEDSSFNKYKVHVELGIDDGETLHRKVSKSYDIHKLKIAMEEMKPVEREIVLFSNEYDCFPTIERKNTRQFPKDLRKIICEKYNITDLNFRKIKQIAFEKIIACRI